MARTESNSNLCPNTTHTHTLSHTHTHTYIGNTNTHAFQRNNRNEWLITPAGIVNDLPRLRRPLGAFVGSIHSTIWKRERQQKRERDRQLLWQGASSWQATAAASRESQEMVNKWKSYADSRRPFSHSLSLCLPSHSFSLSLFPSLLHNYTIKWNLAIQFNALFAVNCAV